MREAFGLLSLALVGGCAQPVRNEPMPVEEARTWIHKWNGKVLIVEGWLGECQYYSCLLYSSLEDAMNAERGDYHSKEWSRAMRRSLSVGGGAAFDWLARPLQYRHVKITGRLDATCIDAMCFDRASHIHPYAIRPANYFQES